MLRITCTTIGARKRFGASSFLSRCASRAPAGADGLLCAPGCKSTSRRAALMPRSVEQWWPSTLPPTRSRSCCECVRDVSADLAPMRAGQARARARLIDSASPPCAASEKRPGCNFFRLGFLARFTQWLESRRIRANSLTEASGRPSRLAGFTIVFLTFRATSMASTAQRPAAFNSLPCYTARYLKWNISLVPKLESRRL